MTDDPLDGADIGETLTVERTEELSVWGVAPDVYFGADRDSDVEVVDAEVVGEPGAERVKLTFEGKVTKYLAPRWDQAREPRTEEERRQARRDKRKRQLLELAAITLPFGIVSVVSLKVMQTISGEMAINGEAMQFSPETFVPVLAIVFLITLWFQYGPGWVSPRGGRR
jgi:hypothetical protein